MTDDVAASRPYHAAFYESVDAGTRRSSSAVVPALVQLFQPTSVVDVGCGTGAWLAAFKEHGVSDLLGVEGTWIRDAQLALPATYFRHQDLTAAIRLDRRFDLVLCLEVAEHLPTEAAAPFVESLTRLGPVVVFSAAIPFQRGEGHVNEQWPGYWTSLFAARGFRCLDILRGRFWADDSIDAWYRQNLLCYVSGERGEEIERRAAADPSWQIRPFALVHPAQYESLARENDDWARYVDSLKLELADANERLMLLQARLDETTASLDGIRRSLPYRVYRALRSLVPGSERPRDIRAAATADTIPKTRS